MNDSFQFFTDQKTQAQSYQNHIKAKSPSASIPKNEQRTRKVRQISDSFDLGSSSQFLNPQNFSDFYDPALIDFEGGVAVTEMTDAELKRLGFPVPTKSPDLAATPNPAYIGGPDFPSVLESPYFQFTSRKYTKEVKKSV